MLILMAVSVAVSFLLQFPIKILRQEFKATIRGFYQFNMALRAN